MNPAQHKFVNLLVWNAVDSRTTLHDIAGALMAVLLLASLIGLGVLWLWMVRGGLSQYFAPRSCFERKILEKWLREP